MDFKKLLLIACLFVGFSSFAQKRLEFNRIVSITGNNSQAYQYSILDTVPLSKAFKITTFNTNGSYSLFINSMTVNQYVSSISNKLPIWLKEGDVLGVKSHNNSTNNFFHISGIEFNIVE